MTQETEASITDHGISVVNLTKSYGDTVLFEDITFTVEQGEFMVIVGPSGCGKSSLMRVIAGIEEHGPGQVLVDGRDVTDAHPGDRSLSMVFQDYALYPHMSVESNLAFGLRARRVPTAEVRRRVEQTAKVVGLTDQLKKKPGQLSGGQRQRVALGRAMIQEPRAFLMDEPLSNLDAALRVQMRAELMEFHQRVGGTVLYVTHDQVEAMTMGNRVAVMNKGRFEQVGTPEEVYSRPVNEYVATFLGSPRMNIIDATVTGTSGSLTIEMLGLSVPLPAADGAVSGGAVRVGLRPEAIELVDDGVPGAVHGHVEYIENLGNEKIVHVRVDNADAALVARVSPRPLSVHDRVGAAIDVERLHVFTTDGAAVWHGPRA